MSVFLSIVAALGLLVLTGTIIVFRRVFIDMAADGLHKPGASHTNNLKKSQAAVDSCMSAILFIFGPTVLFILAYEFTPVDKTDRIIAASVALATAALMALVYRLAKPLPDRPKFPWRNLIIISMAGLTVALNDPFFIQVRPTVTNIIAALLALGAVAGISPRLEGLFKRGSVTLDDAGWHKLVAASVLLFVAMAAANEYVRRFETEAIWVYFQLWGPPLFSLVFLVAAYPVIKRHMPAGQCPAKPRTPNSEPSNAD